MSRRRKRKRAKGSEGGTGYDAESANGTAAPLYRRACIHAVAAVPAAVRQDLAESGKVPVFAFCVEQGRWSQRGAERVQVFDSSKYMISTKELKMAVKSKKDQSAVWREVAKTQAALQVSAPASPTSLQLTLESRTVADAVDGYLKALTGIAAAKPDAVGFAFAINGAVNSADVYSSPALFAAMWPKLLRSSAVEAVGRLKTDERFQPTTSEAIHAFLREAEKGKQSAADVDQRVRLATYAGDDQLLFESQEGAGWIHRNYIKK
jgi:hypothetical protein